MYRWQIVIALAMAFSLSLVESKEKCSQISQEEAEEACSDTTYESYVECMRKRTKRSIDCYEEDEGCDGCDCSSCEYGTCGSCSSCCESYEQQIVSCHSRSCCHNTCNNNCRSSSCRRRCRSSCRERIVEHETSSLTKGGSQSLDSRHNITTVINLHNLINNTNIIDMPITINNTNLNNITLDNQSGTSNGCCKIIGPRQCVPTPNYPFSKCFHMRKNHCGNICTNSIMHAEPHQICEQANGQNQCEQLVSFIPQPKPSCAYTSVYPYVSCSVNEHNCAGCYNHLVHGGSPPAQCSSQNCYDHSMNVGPMQNGYQLSNFPRMPLGTYNEMFQGFGGIEGVNGLGGMGSMGGFNPEENGYMVSSGNHSRRNADPGISELMKELQAEPKMDGDKLHQE